MSDLLYDLVQSLNKSEKRNFNLYVSKYNKLKNNQSAILFKAINRQEEYDEEKLRKATSKYISKEQFTYAKHRLKNQILESLIDLHFVRSKDANIISMLSKIELGFRVNHTKISEEWIEKGLDLCEEKGYSAWAVVLLSYKIRYLFQTERSNKNSKIVRRLLIDTCNKIARDQEYVCVYDDAMECMQFFVKEGLTERVQSLLKKVKQNSILLIDEKELSGIHKVNYYKTKHLISTIDSNYTDAAHNAFMVVNLYAEDLEKSRKNLRPYLLSISNLIQAALNSNDLQLAQQSILKLEAEINTYLQEENDYNLIFNSILETNKVFFYCMKGDFNKIIEQRSQIDAILVRYKDSQWLNIRQTLLCLVAAYFVKEDFKACLDVVLEFNQLPITKTTETMLLHLKFYEFACHEEIKNEKFKISVLRSLDYYLKKRNNVKGDVEENVFQKLIGNEYDDNFDFKEDNFYMNPFLKWLNKSK